MRGRRTLETIPEERKEKEIEQEIKGSKIEEWNEDEMGNLQDPYGEL